VDLERGSVLSVSVVWGKLLIFSLRLPSKLINFFLYRRHFAIQFAKALGAEQVVAFSHSDSKKQDAHDLGATDFVSTGDGEFAENWAMKLDLIIVSIFYARLLVG
jgi:hypothetical protein